MIRMKVMRSCWTTTIQTLKKNTSMAAPILSIDRPIDFKPGATARSVCCTKLMLLRYALVYSRLKELLPFVSSWSTTFF